MSEKVDHVVAIFDGKERVFRYPRSTTTEFSAALPDSFSPYAALKRLSGGSWTTHDIERALSGHGSNPMLPWRPDPGIVKVLCANGPGRYAVLAALVLQAALFGLDSADATFSDADASTVPA